MLMRQRLGLAALFIVSLCLAACGAKQGKNAKITANWNALYDAVPADATYAVGHRLNNEGSVPTILHGTLITLFEGNVAAILDNLAQDDLLAEAELVAFQRKGAQWLITEVSDMPRAMEQLADHYENLAEGYGETLSLEQDRVGERVILRLVDRSIDEAGVYTEITGVGDYILVYSSASDDVERAQADLRLLSKDWADIGRYADTDHGKAQRARAQNQPLASWATVNIAELNRALQDPNARGGIAEWREMLGASGHSDTDECAAYNARLERLLPSVSMVKYDDNDGKTHTDTWLELSESGVANGRVIMQGAPALKGFAQDALLALGVSFDFGNFFDAMYATPAHAGCGGLAGIAGQLADALSDYAAHIKFNARSVSGTGVLVVEDVNLQGFIPTATVGAYIGSPNAEALFRRLVRTLNKYGSADVVADATTPMVEGSFSGAPMKIRIEQGEDRVLVYASTLKGSLASRLLTVSPHGDADVPFELQVNGDRLQKLQDDARSYVDDMQMEDARVEDALNILPEEANGLRVRFAFESGGLRITVDQE